MSPSFNDHLLSSSRIIFQTKIYQFFYFSILFSLLLFPLFSTFSSGLSMFSWFRSRREKRGTSDRSQQLVFLEVRWPVEKEKKKQYVLFWKISHDVRATMYVSFLPLSPFFFYFEMKFDYWHAQELILENWLDRIWIVCCNSRNIVVFMVRDLMDIILFNSFLFFKCIRNFTCKDQLYVLQKLHFDIFINRKTNRKKSTKNFLFNEKIILIFLNVAVTL